MLDLHRLPNCGCLVSRKLRSMVSLLRSSIVTHACFIDPLAAHIVQFAITVWKDLIIIVLGSGNVSVWYVFISLKPYRSILLRSLFWSLWGVFFFFFPWNSFCLLMCFNILCRETIGSSSCSSSRQPFCVYTCFHSAGSTSRGLCQQRKYLFGKR